MKANTIRSGEGTGLVASGCSGNWCVEIDQSLDSDEYFARLDGPAFYFDFQVIAEFLNNAVALLVRHRSPGRSQNGAGADSDVTIGRFAGKRVTLVRDTEFDDRCFLVIRGPKGTALNYTFTGQDLNDFAAALKQAADELNEAD